MDLMEPDSGFPAGGAKTDNAARANEIVKTWLSMNDTQARLVGQIEAALDNREAAVFRALKVTIRSLADEHGVTVAENEYPCIMLAALVRSIASRAAAPSQEREGEGEARWT